MDHYHDIEFPSGDLSCAGWFFRAESRGSARAPCVILGHGFSGVKEARLDAYAEQFADNGYHALVFDYRHFGQSPGTPRQLLDIAKQQADWRAAISYARCLAEVDPDRIALWGTSFSGGHVVDLAVQDPGIAAVISQVPHMSGIATAFCPGPVHGARLAWAGFRDIFRALSGKTPYYIPAFGKPGELAAMTAPGAYEGSRKLFPEGLAVNEMVAARIILWVPFFSPGKKAARLKQPLLVQVAENDSTTPPRPAVRAAKKAPRGELITYHADHFDVYLPPLFQKVTGDQLDFLARHLG
ncbi:MAG: alpha/beta hydrolase [Desulfosalsimonas sp.]